MIIIVEQFAAGGKKLKIMLVKWLSALKSSNVKW